MRIKHALAKLSTALAALVSNNNSEADFDAAIKAATSLSEKMERLTSFNRNLYLRTCEKLGNYYALDSKDLKKVRQLNELYLKGNIGQLDKLAKAQVDLMVKLTLEKYVDLPDFDAQHVNLYQEKISGLNCDLEFLKNFQMHCNVEQQKVHQNLLRQAANYYEFKASQLQFQADTHKNKSEELQAQLSNSVARSEMKCKHRNDVVSAHINNPQSLFYTRGEPEEGGWAEFLALEAEMDAEMDAKIEAENAEIEALIETEMVEPLPEISGYRPTKMRKLQ